MTEQITRVISIDAPSKVPEIDYVGHLNIVEQPGGANDPFDQPAEDLKKMNGIDTNLKRQTSRKLNKIRQGVDGAKSTQIEEEAEYTGYQMFDVVHPPYNMDYLAKLYAEKSSPHYAAVNAKVANIVGLGYKFIETPLQKKRFESHAGNEKKIKNARRGLEDHRADLVEKLESFNEEDSFTEVLVKVWTDYETMGNGYIEIGRKKNGEIGYIGHIPAQTMRVRKKRDGFVQISGYKLQFFANFGAQHDKDTGEYKPMRNPVGGGRPNEIIHISKYNPISGFYGIPDIVSAAPAIAGNDFASRFNLDYFENKAIPRHVIILKGATLGSNAEAALLAFFETGLKGQNHRSLFIPLPGGDKDNPVDLQIEAIEAGVQDASFEKYRKANINDILMVHRVPITKISVSEGASLAIAKDADKTFKEQVCGPHQKMLEKKINRIIKELTDALELKLNEMTLTDADTQSKIDERAVKGGWMLPNEIRARDGLVPIDGGDERVDLNAKDKIAQAQAEERTTRERDAARSAGATDSAGAARNPKGEGRSIN